MSEYYLLDTSVATLAALRRQSILDRLASADEVYVPEVVYCELFFGAYRYVRLHNSTQFLDLDEEFAANPRFRFPPGDLDTARIYGAIRAELDAKAQPIQSNDIWIAALARQYHLTLLTRDGDFAPVSGLTWELV